MGTTGDLYSLIHVNTSLALLQDWRTRFPAIVRKVEHRVLFLSVKYGIMEELA